MFSTEYELEMLDGVILVVSDIYFNKEDQCLDMNVVSGVRGGFQELDDDELESYVIQNYALIDQVVHRHYYGSEKTPTVH